MATAVVRAETPEEREYARYLKEIDARKLHVADHQAELSLLKEKLGLFSAEYHAQVGTLLVELDRIHLSIDEYEYRITRLQDDDEIAPLDLEGEIRTHFAERQQEVRADEEETRSYERTYHEDLQRPELDERSELELRSLLRELAKRFHPDLARTDVERQRREVIMRRVTAAFHERDVNALQGLMTETDFDDPAFESRPIGEKLIWAIREVSRLDGLIESIVAEQESLMTSSLARLWRRQEAGEDIIERLMHTTISRIEEAQLRLDDVIERCRRMMHEAGYGR